MDIGNDGQKTENYKVVLIHVVSHSLDKPLGVFSFCFISFFASFASPSGSVLVWRVFFLVCLSRVRLGLAFAPFSSNQPCSYFSAAWGGLEGGYHGWQLEGLLFLLVLLTSQPLVVFIRGVDRSMHRHQRLYIVERVDGMGEDINGYIPAGSKQAEDARVSYGATVYIAGDLVGGVVV